ncbi:amino acid ABC transporter substrate-binding protein [Brachyspira pilosicoli]|uniref:Polar amino acid uptake ABC transporter, PAAT family, amino acid-binding protein n=4 Tax=Brachyspira pilosicoli TaxID=52584 RepID=D8ICV8_BRAP9|nr:amino acid ABC transporter substrate-binding protein [Brachyspira pilosicoli]ADB22527.1 oligopeptide-binding protein 5 [Brachyspira pilosicoli]ADK30981.1 polar amino acid uptake ABC transporter, PAAT family, amino acid-binding protein [Brachyspira pilosicoli 95/1000]AGA67205.1 polar amino acid uptake ABC transporter amino acid-binding protein [Brachyspira pilosicoli P43/6/78]PLV55871.1 amino acid ABC transporter substrate-binding protein [Brachyspira pilosicoli SP16]WIH81002.1 amino acid AB
MKRIITLFFIFIFAISCSKTQTQNTEVSSADNSLQKVKENGKLVLGLDDTLAPMGFRDDNGEIVGFDIDLAREVANRLGVELEAKPIDWSSAILSLKKGDVDVIWNGFAVNESRKQQVNFTKPYLYNRLMIAKYSDRDDINSKEELKGKIVGVQSGSSNYETLVNDPVSKEIKEIRQYDSYVNAFLDLEAKRIDAVIVDEIVARYYISKENADFTLLEDKPITSQYLSVGLRKTDTELLNAIDKALDDMRADGKAAEISTKWFGKDVFIKG